MLVNGFNARTTWPKHLNGTDGGHEPKLHNQVWSVWMETWPGCPGCRNVQIAPEKALDLHRPSTPVHRRSSALSSGTRPEPRLERKLQDFSAFSTVDALLLLACNRFSLLDLLPPAIPFVPLQHPSTQRTSLWSRLVTLTSFILHLPPYVSVERPLD